MLIEKVTRDAEADEDGAGVAIRGQGSGVVQDAPAGDEVELVDVVFDVGDAVFYKRWGGGRGGCGLVTEGEAGVVKVGGCAAEGIDFLR